MGYRLRPVRFARQTARERHAHSPTAVRHCLAAGLFGEARSAIVCRRVRSAVAGGRKPSYDATARERILAEARRTPEPEQDGTAVWSLVTLRESMRW